MVGWLLGRPLNAVLGWLFRRFNDGLRRATSVYLRGVGMLLRVSTLVLVLYGGLLVSDLLGYMHTPKGFIPTQDMGYLLVNVQLPDAASAERTADDYRAGARRSARRAGRQHTRDRTTASRSC